MSSFAELGLRPQLLEALAQVGYHEMTEIQQQALPRMLEGVDLIGKAKTGSGKTAAFALALLNGIDVDRNAPQALVLCPTRELAQQVAAEVRRLAQRLSNVQILTLTGGRSYRDQRISLERGPQVIVGTPGRIAEHIDREHLSLDALGVVVLDEADRMLDMGFIEQVDGIVSQCPRRRQTLLFSATYPDRIATLSATVQRDPQTIEVEALVAKEKLQQWRYACALEARKDCVAQVLATFQPSAALIFCETRADTDALADFLRRKGAVTLALHGQMEQRDRDDMLLQLANGSASVLVSTNLAARGLDISSLPLVIVSEVSPDPEVHLHRIGRTGRAGEDGVAVSIVARPPEEHRLQRVEAYMGTTIAEGPPLQSGPLDFLTPPNRTLILLSGRKDKIRKGDVVGALVKDGGIPGDAVGQIDLRDRTTAIAIDKAYADKAYRYLQRGRIKKTRVKAILLGG